MSKLIGYFEAALQGVGRYFETNKLVVLLLALLLAGWLAEKKPVGEKGRLLYTYTLVITLLLLCPISAMFVMLYQTAFYDYEWAWSMVPLTVGLAYGAAVVLKKNVQKGKMLLGILGVTAVLLVCGNQGTLLTVDKEEARAQENTAEILQELYDFGMNGKRMLWAPREIMEQVRRLDGKILLIYGRDMWDTKAGAYDYEAYSAELTNSYVWLELLQEQAELASIMADPAASFAILCKEEDLDSAGEEYLQTVLDAGANVLVLPNLIADHIEERILKLAEERRCVVQNTYTEEYTIYLLE